MDIEKIINDTINRNSLVKVNNKIYLKKYQIEVLEMCHIDYRNASSVKEILFLIEEAIEYDNEINNELLEDVASSLQEFDYYNNTNK